VDPAKPAANTVDPKFRILRFGQRTIRSGVGVCPRKKKGSKIMPLIQLVEVLIVVGVLLWLVNRFIPMQGSIKSILNGVVVIAVVLWLLNIFGLFHSLSGIRLGRG
jgi:hypothetical protein